MWGSASIRTRPGLRSGAIALAVALATLALATNAWATTIALTTPPTLPALGAVTLNGRSQTTTTTWTLTNNFTITSSGSNNGWKLTVGANTSGGTYSAVFKQYCPNATCGTDTGPGYVASGFTLPANSLTLNTTTSGWTSGGTKPAYQCGASCNVDSAAATKVVSASTSVALASWTSSGSAFLTLATPTTLHKLQASEVYRVDIVWTAATGP
jgi:hypothetical protein